MMQKSTKSVSMHNVLQSVDVCIHGSIRTLLASMPLQSFCGLSSWIGGVRLSQALASCRDANQGLVFWQRFAQVV
jgi:energy-converting hydrogenase Eha subunit C